MPAYKIRLFEELLLYGYGDVTIDAATPEEAAEIVLKARREAVSVEGDDPVITLPDGKTFTVDPTDQSLDTRCFCVLLSDETPVGDEPIELRAVGDVPKPLDYLAGFDDA